MLLVAETFAVYNLSWTVVLGNPMAVREIVELPGCLSDNVFNNSPRQSFLGKSVIGSSDSFLQSPIVALSFRDMCLSGAVFHLDIKVITDGIHDGAKFIIATYLVNAKSICIVQAENFIQTGM